MDARILLVEDDPSIREVTAIGLGAAGFEVATAVDGVDALERFRAEPYDLILLDELIRHAGQVLSRDVLLDRVWGYDYLGDSRLVDVAIQRLRSKVETDPATPELIQTVRGSGYKAVR